MAEVSFELLIGENCSSCSPDSPSLTPASIPLPALLATNCSLPFTQPSHVHPCLHFQYLTSCSSRGGKEQLLNTKGLGSQFQILSELK